MASAASNFRQAPAPQTLISAAFGFECAFILRSRIAPTLRALELLEELVFQSI